MTVIVGGMVLVLALVGLFGWRLLDLWADRWEMDRLLALQPSDPPRFSASMVSDLPDAARRYFTFAIAEGTPLLSVAVIEMTGKMSIGTKGAPNYMDMKASQVLAFPEGFIWKVSTKAGMVCMSGSDSASWTQFWLFHLAPVVRAGGTEDHKRSAFGRYVAEAVFWTPAALVPRPGVTWQSVSDNVARVVVAHNWMEQSVDVTIDDAGRPIEVGLPR